jgi:hypothetical protein
MKVELTPAQIRWLLACIRSADHAEVAGRSPIRCDFYEPVVFELLSHLTPEPDQ